MIVRLTGTVGDVTEESVVIERDGVGREVLVPGYAIGELTAVRGRQVTLHTMQYLEGSATGGNLIPRLVGFLYPEDRDFFKQFTSVKGIGARKALRALTEPVRRVAMWIEQADVSALRSLPGVGSRAAEMIVAELKGKLDQLAVGGGADVDARSDRARFTAAQRDALEVLIALGDARADAQRWIERAAQLHPDIGEPDEWVKAAYRVRSGVEG